MFSHDVYTGKCNRGLMVVGSLRHLVQDRTLSQDEEKKALILGWCIEWVRPTYLTTVHLYTSLFSVLP